MKRQTTYILISALILSVILVGCANNTDNLKEININDYLMVEFSGNNGVGEATITGFEEFKETVLEELARDIDGLEVEKILLDICYKLDKSTELSNGDVITLSIEIGENLLEEYGIKIIGETKTFTVIGLSERDYKEINPFDLIELVFYGTSPNIYVHIIEKEDLGFGVYAPMNYFGYSVGDTFMIKFYYVEEQAEEKGIIITETLKEFVVPEPEN